MHPVRSSVARRRSAVLVALLLMLAAGVLSAMPASCCRVSTEAGMGRSQDVEAGLVDLDTPSRDAAVVRTAGDPVVRAWAEDRGANARAAALVGILLALAVVGPRAGPAASPPHRGRPCVVRRRHSISLRAPPRLRLTL